MTGKKATNNATGTTYSNIDAPKDKLFAVEHGVEVELGDAAADANPDWATSKIPAANTYTGGAATGSIQGTFQGVEGTFPCVANDCPADGRLPREGELTAPSLAPKARPMRLSRATGIFVPTDEAAIIKVQDTDHLSFGYWLSTKGGPVGFGVWYEGNANVAQVEADITTLDEKVTYTGAAAGKYATKDDIDNTASAGYFTASAKLTADFTGRGW